MGYRRPGDASAYSFNGAVSCLQLYDAYMSYGEISRAASLCNPTCELHIVDKRVVRSAFLNSWSNHPKGEFRKHHNWSCGCINSLVQFLTFCKLDLQLIYDSFKNTFWKQFQIAMFLSPVFLFMSKEKKNGTFNNLVRHDNRNSQFQTWHWILGLYL